MPSNKKNRIHFYYKPIISDKIYSNLFDKNTSQNNSCNNVSSSEYFTQLVSPMIFIIKGFWTIVFIFIVISITFRPICPPAFFRCLSNLETFMELRTSFIESMGVVCSDSVSHNQVHVLSIPLLLLTCSQDWTSNLQMIVSFEA